MVGIIGFICLYATASAAAPAAELYLKKLLPEDTAQFTYACLDSPYSIAMDGEGNIYVADSGHHRIQKFTAEGRYLTQWGSYGAGNGQFIDPYGVAVDGAGNVYAADSLFPSRLQKFSADGAWLASWAYYEKGNGQSGQFYGPAGLAVVRGNLYVADESGNCVLFLSTSGRPRIAPLLLLLY